MSDADYDFAPAARRQPQPSPLPRPLRHPPPPPSPKSHLGTRRLTSSTCSGAKCTTDGSNTGIATRPMTAVSGAGYGSRRVATLSTGGGEDHASAALSAVHPALLPHPTPGSSSGSSKPSTATLVAKQDDSPESLVRGFERQVHDLLEASALAAKKGQTALALDKAKEAQRKERALVRCRELNNLADTVNGELTYAVALHLGSMYERSGMGDEALQVYQGLIKQRAALPPIVGWVRLNMGNVHYRQARYTQAVKMYRMALDQIPSSTHKATRLKVYRNLGHTFVRLGQWSEAVQAYEMVVLNPTTHPEGGGGGGGGEGGREGGEEGGVGGSSNGSGGGNVLAQSTASALFSSSSFGLTSPHVVVFGDYFRTAYHLLLCYLALGQTEKMKRAFVKMVSTVAAPPGEQEEEEDGVEDMEGGVDEHEEVRKAAMGGREEGRSVDGAGGKEEERPDFLREEMRRRRKEAAHYLLQAGKLIAPVVDGGGWNNGFRWVVEALRRGNHDEVSCQVELERARAFLRDKQFDAAVEVLKAFEKKDERMRALAASNLSFIYFLEGELDLAEEYAEMAIKQNRYNAAALVNKANCVFQRGDPGKAKELYLEALGVEADCLEAIFNLGLANLRLGLLSDAQSAYEKLHTLIPHCPEVIYQLGYVAEAQGQLPQAIKWFQVLLLGLNNRGKGSRSSSRSSNKSRKSSIQKGEGEEGEGERGMSSSSTSASLASPPTTVHASGHGRALAAAVAATAASTATSAAAVVTGDDGVLARLGRLYQEEGDDGQALHHFQESDRVNPHNLEVISWLGLWHARQEQYTSALPYFRRAAALDPHSSQWPLMQASCHRRLGDFPRALGIYQSVHASHPEDSDCLNALVVLCQDLGRPWEGYQQRLVRLQERGRGTGRGSAGGAGGVGREVRGFGVGERPRKKKGVGVEDVDVGSLLI